MRLGDNLGGGAAADAAFTVVSGREAAASAGAIAGAATSTPRCPAHLPGPWPVTTIASGPVPDDGDERLGAQVAAALDEVTGEAITAVGDLVASAATAPAPATGPAPGAVRGIEAVAWQLAEQQVAVLLVASDISQDYDPDYRLGSSPTQFGAGDEGAGIPVPLEDGLVWAALHQDAIVVQLPDRSGALRPAGGGTAAPRSRFLRLAARGFAGAPPNGQVQDILAGQTRVLARVITGSMARPWTRLWMTRALHRPGGHPRSPKPSSTSPTSVRREENARRRHHPPVHGRFS